MIELLLQAERALSVGLLDRAETLYRQVAKADPRNSIAVVGLARVTLDRGDDVEALALARRALEIDPENDAAIRLAARLEEVIDYRLDAAEALGLDESVVDTGPATATVEGGGTPESTPETEAERTAEGDGEWESELDPAPEQAPESEPEPEPSAEIPLEPTLEPGPEVEIPSSLTAVSVAVTPGPLSEPARRRSLLDRLFRRG